MAAVASPGRFDNIAPFVVAGRFGMLTVAADGSATYALGGIDPAGPQPLPALGSATSVTEVFDYTVRDATGAVANATLSVAVVRAAPATIAGTPGADTLAASPAGARVEGGDGDDSLSGSYGSDVLVGGPGNDRLSGLIEGRVATATLAGADLFIGGPGDDAIAAGGGTTDIAAFAGRRAGYSVTPSGDTVTVRDIDPTDGDDGTDTLTGVEYLQFADQLTMTVSQPFNTGSILAEVLADTAIDVTAGSVNLTPPAGPATSFSFYPTTTLLAADGAAGPAWLAFDKSQSRLTGTPPAGTEGLIDLVIRGNPTSGQIAYDTVRLFLYAPRAGDQVGTVAAESFAGTTGADRVFKAGPGDVIAASAGADVYAGDHSPPPFGVARALLDYSGSNAGIYLDLTLGIARGGFAEGDIILGIGSVIATPFNDVIVASTGSETVDPGAGDDIVRIPTFLSSVRVLGGPGADVVDGNPYRAGVVDYSASPAPVTVDLVTNVNQGGHAEGDRLYGVSLVIGSAGGDTIRLDGVNAFNSAASARGGDGDDHLVGGTGYNDLQGDAGNDRLEGGEGDDRLVGGGGADTLDGGAGSDTIDYASEQRSTGVTIDLGVGTGPDGDRFVSIENVVGTFFADTITGSDGDNRIIALGGGDRVYGLGGNDTIEAGYGGFTDVELDGGAGIDTLSLSGYTLVDLSAGVASTASNGNSVIANFENATINGAGTVVGNAGDNILWATQQGDATLDGRDGNDDLRGGYGNDRLIGGGGADRIVGSYYQIYGGIPAATDTADYSTSSAGVHVDLRNGRATGGHAEGDTLVGIESLDGSAFGDVLVSQTLASGALKGLAGDDILVEVSGGAGTTSMTGGGGADTFVIALSSPSGAAAVSALATDFTQGVDKIDLSDLRDAQGNVLDIADILASATVQNGSTLLDLDPFTGPGGADLSGTLTLQSFTGTLTAADFAFVNGVDWESMVPTGPAVV